MRKDYVKTLFSRMLTTYLTVTIGILIVAGVTVGALLQGYLTREKKDMLAREFGVGHVTLEMELAGGECAGSTCDIVPGELGGNNRHVEHQH